MFDPSTYFFPAKMRKILGKNVGAWRCGSGWGMINGHFDNKYAIKETKQRTTRVCSWGINILNIILTISFIVQVSEKFFSCFPSGFWPIVGFPFKQYRCSLHNPLATKLLYPHCFPHGCLWASLNVSHENVWVSKNYQQTPCSCYPSHSRCHTLSRQWTGLPGTFATGSTATCRHPGPSLSHQGPSGKWLLGNRGEVVLAKTRHPSPWAPWDPNVVWLNHENHRVVFPARWCWGMLF